MNLYSECRGKGKPLLMIHGIMSDHTYFEKTAAFLENDYQVITYDRRGYGIDSNEIVTDYSLVSQAEDICDIIGCQKPVYVVGHSAGGLVALQFGIMHPELVHAMVLIEPALMFDEEANTKIREWNNQLNKYRDNKDIKGVMRLFADNIGSVKSTSTESSSIEQIKRSFKNVSNFVYGELNDIQICEFEYEKLKQLPFPVFIGITEFESIYSIAAEKSATALNWPVIRFSGSHSAPVDAPEPFAVQVANCFREEKT